MKFLTTISILFILTFSSLFSAIDVDEVKEKLALIQNTGNSGRDFWFTVPPVYNKESTTDNKIKILLFSSVRTKVEVNIKGRDYSNSFELQPNRVEEVELDSKIIQAIEMETNKIPKSDIYKQLAVNIKSEFPMLVYVISRYQYTSEGFFAIPVSAFGTEYICMSYNGNNNHSYKFNSFTGVVAAYDNTNINITMGGGLNGGDEIEFRDGRTLKTGESTIQKMDKGDVLLLNPKLESQDLSGTLFSSNNPFSIVSGVSCAYIPENTNSCNYIVNMETPTYLWGRNFFITPQMDRVYNGIVRIYASEDNTTVYRDGVIFGKIIKGGGDGINKSFFEKRLWEKEGKKSSPNLAQITSDKPIAIIYLNTNGDESSSEKYSRLHKPFLMQIPPIEQAVNNTIIASPNPFPLGGKSPIALNCVVIISELENHKIPNDVLIATLSENGEEPEYVKLNEKYKPYPLGFEQKYNNKLYGSIILHLGVSDVYSIKSDSTKFITYSFGLDDYESYGFPSTFSLKDKSKLDTIAPNPIYVKQCSGDIFLENSTVVDLPNQVEERSNLADIYMMNGENYTFVYDSTNFIPGVSSSVNWALKVINKDLPASALLYFIDRSGNDTLIYIEHNNTPKPFITSSNDYKLMNPKIPSITFQDTIRNLSSNSSLIVTRVKIPNQESPFKITSFEGGWIPGTPIPPLEERYLNITFQMDKLENNRTYSDSLFIGLGFEDEGGYTECKFFSVSELKTSIYFPEYSLEDGNNFGEFDESSKAIKLTDTIRNLSASAPLNISRLELKDGNKGYRLGGFTPFDWDLSKPIAPNSEVVVDIIFNPKSIEQGEEDIELTDSLGIGISVMNANNELEELEFSYKTEQKAILKAKDLSSVTPEQTLAEYMTVTESSIQILPQALADGFTELSVFSLDGSKVISANVQNQNSVAISNLKSGTYIITLKSENRLLTRKINIVK